MIAFVEGYIDEVKPTHCILNVGGIGYQIQISLRTFSEIQTMKEVKLFTTFIVREDAQILYGFFTFQEKEFFQALLSVNGVGPVSALMMLSTLNVAEIKNAIVHSDVNTLQSVKGIGNKSAQRIILDLKDKIQKIEISDKTLVSTENKTKEEALNALEVLGIGKKMAEKNVEKILITNPEAKVEDVIKQVLKNLR